MSSSSSGTAAPSGTGQTNAPVSIHVDPTTMVALMAQKAGDDEAARELMASGPATHHIKLELSDVPLLDLRSRLGTTSFLDEYQLTLTPADVRSPLQGELHVEVIKQSWPDLHSVSLSTALGSQVEIKDGTGASYSVDLTQDIKLKSFTLEGTLTTDFSSHSPQMSGEISLKWEF